MLKEYAVDLIKILTFVGIASNFLHTRQSKTARLALGIVLISAIMLPLVDIMPQNKAEFDEIFSFDDYNDAEMNDNTLEELFEDAIEEYVEGLYGLDRGDVTVKVDGFDMSSMKAERIYVSVSGRALTLDYRRLEDELSKEFTNGGDCEVELNIG